MGRFVCVRDVHGVMLAQHDPELMALHHAAAMVTPDGMPLAVIGRLRGLPVRKTSGADLMALVMDIGRQHGLRHYFYGGAPGVAEQLKHVCETLYPGVSIVGLQCPPFREQTAAEVEATRTAILACGAQLVWVGLSTPKQEKWMKAYAPLLPATLLGVGAAFDFHTGRVRRAPRWMQQSGLEWLHRLSSEPRRLWYRYLVLAPQFLYLILTHSRRAGKRR